jgi:transposase
VLTLRPDDIVTMDNLSSHKGFRARRAIRDADAKLWFLPPYSPDLNLSNRSSPSSKTLLRKADERTIEAIWQRIGQLLDCFSPQECQNYVANSRYASN